MDNQADGRLQADGLGNGGANPGEDKIDVLIRRFGGLATWAQQVQAVLHSLEGKIDILMRRLDVGATEPGRAPVNPGSGKPPRKEPVGQPFPSKYHGGPCYYCGRSWPEGEWMIGLGSKTYCHLRCLPPEDRARFAEAS